MYWLLYLIYDQFQFQFHLKRGFPWITGGATCRCESWGVVSRPVGFLASDHESWAQRSQFIAKVAFRRRMFFMVFMICSVLMFFFFYLFLNGVSLFRFYNVYVYSQKRAGFFVIFAVRCFNGCFLHYVQRAQNLRQKNNILCRLTLSKSLMKNAKAKIIFSRDFAKFSIQAYEYFFLGLIIFYPPFVPPSGDLVGKRLHNLPQTNTVFC